MLTSEQIAAYVRECGPWLYHVTEARAHETGEQSLADGVEQSGLKGVDMYHPKPSVYLSSRRPWLGTGHELGDAIFRVDIRQLDPALIEADEWQLIGDATWGHLGGDSLHGVSSDHLQGLADPEVTWHTLMNVTSAAIAYRGDIPRELLERVDHMARPTLSDGPAAPLTAEPQQHSSGLGY
jgi:hypothetical protein